MQKDILQDLLTAHNISIHSFTAHSKASEKYVELTFKQDNGFVWQGSIPYFYRRTGLFIKDEVELAAYLIKIKPYFFQEKIDTWIKEEVELWNTNFVNKVVTKPFFDVLSQLNWTSDFPPNDNPQRRIQDIKEMGYSMATRFVGKKTERLLVPIPRSEQTGYETFSAKFRTKAIKVLNELNIYELSNANKNGLLPDHKFPEIRWDVETRAKNTDDMTDIEIKNKFQLIDNQRNQQKREVCRKCFQTGKRGVIFGVKFFYEGDENWDNTILTIGKEAEKGCVGCGWYDIEKWREELNKHIK